MINNSNKIINSKESILYIDNDIIHKIFKDNINKENRIKTIELFLNTKIDGCPEIVDFIYGNNNDIIGYTMKYYKKAFKFSQNMKFKFKKEKCQELIDIYLKIKNNFNLLYSDFHNDNIFINDLSILLLEYR